MQALRDAMGQLKSRNAVVFGVSADTVESHKGFVDKYNLNFPLLADPDHKMIEAYGALMPNGKFANRYTFVIGPDGRIVSIDRNVNGQFDRAPAGLTSRHGTNLALLLSNWQAKVGAPVPSFSVPAASGGTLELLPAGKKAAVVVFVSTQCPVSKAYEGRLAALAADPAYKDVAFLGLDPNANESAKRVDTYFGTRRLGFEVAKDEKAGMAAHFGATVTPTVWVVDGRGTAVYRGAPDDNAKPDAATKPYLKEALDAVLAGKPVAVAETKASGCAIRRK